MPKNGLHEKAESIYLAHETFLKENTQSDQLCTLLCVMGEKGLDKMACPFCVILHCAVYLVV